MPLRFPKGLCGERSFAYDIPKTGKTPMKCLSSAQRVFSIKSSPFQMRVRGKTLDVDDVGAGGLFLLVFLVVSPVGGGAALLVEVVERVLVVGRVLVVSSGSR